MSSKWCTYLRRLWYFRGYFCSIILIQPNPGMNCDTFLIRCLFSCCQYNPDWRLCSIFSILSKFQNDTEKNRKILGKWVIPKNPLDMSFCHGGQCLVKQAKTQSNGIFFVKLFSYFQVLYATLTCLMKQSSQLDQTTYRQPHEVLCVFPSGKRQNH